MRRAVVAAGVLFLAAGIGSIGAGSEPEEEADDRRIRAVAGEWQTAYNAKDADGVASLYAEDAFYVSAHVVAQGRSQIRAYFQRGIAAGGHVDDIRILASRRSCDLAYTVGTYQATNDGVTVRGRNVVVLRKVAGEWRIVAHESVVADQP